MATVWQGSGHGWAPLYGVVQVGGVREARFTDYWRDIGTVDAYWAAHRDLLSAEPPLDLDDPDWPILTKAPTTRASARVCDGAAGAVVRAGATVQRAVLDDGVEACADVGGPDGEIALVGLRARVSSPVPPGGRFPQD